MITKEMLEKRIANCYEIIDEIHLNKMNFDCCGNLRKDALKKVEFLKGEINAYTLLRDEIEKDR